MSKAKVRWFVDWWVNQGPTDILAIWITICLGLLYAYDDVGNVPDWTVIGWGIILMGWIYYRLSTIIDTMYSKQKGKKSLQ